MEGYFSCVVKSLKIDEVTILGLLEKHEANAEFKSVKRSFIYGESKLTEANYRKALSRLEALKFIRVSVGQRDHYLHITEFGSEALRLSLEEVVSQC